MLCKAYTNKPLQCLAVAVLLLLSACRKTSEYDKQRVSNAKAALLDEARLTDVSLPVGIIAYDITAQPTLDKHGLIVTYEANFARSMLLEFYQLEMERLGWKEFSSFSTVPFESSEEIVLVFEKPRKLCVIAMRSYAAGQKVTIFIGPRA